MTRDRLSDFKPEGEKLSFADRLKSGAMMALVATNPILSISDAVTGNTSQQKRLAAVTYGRKYTEQEEATINQAAKKKAAAATSFLPWFLDPNDGIGKYVLIAVGVVALYFIYRVFFARQAAVLDIKKVTGVK